MSVKIYVPCDAAAVSVGADAVAKSVAEEIAARRLNATLVRNGSRGMFWLEPLVEVETPQGRIAYGPVSVDSVAGLFDTGFLEDKPHALHLGPTEEIPFLKRQERLTFARCGLPIHCRSRITSATAAIAGSNERSSSCPRRLWRKSPIPGCAGEAALDFPLESSGARCSIRRPTKSILYAMRTKATAEPTRPHDHGGRPVRPDRRNHDRGYCG